MKPDISPSNTQDNMSQSPPSAQVWVIFVNGQSAGVPLLFRVPNPGYRMQTSLHLATRTPTAERAILTSVDIGEKQIPLVCNSSRAEAQQR